MIVDGKEGKRYDNLGSLVFSQDSSRIVYAAQETKKWFVVIDGKEGKKYDSAGHLTVSPDDKTVVYTARLGDRQSTVAAGKEGKQYDGIFPIIFDSPNSFHYLAKDAGMYYLVEETLR